MTSRRPRRPKQCRPVTLNDGTVLRVAGMNRATEDEIRDRIEPIVEAMRVMDGNRCPEHSNIELPKLAQRPGLTHYQCGRPAGHEGPHRWPAHDGSITEWTTPQPEEER